MDLPENQRKTLMKTHKTILAEFPDDLRKKDMEATKTCIMELPESQKNMMLRQMEMK